MNTVSDFNLRDPLAGVAEQFHSRWSPRAYSKGCIPEEHQAQIFDAARWAPSCYNEQPWRFITSTEDSFDRFLALLMDMNQAWAKNASLLGVLVARRNFSSNGKENQLAQFDCGAAWMSMQLQALQLGYHCHGMAGIHYGEIINELKLDSEQELPVCAFAIGTLADRSTLPDKLQEKEQPSARKPLAEIWQQA